MSWSLLTTSVAGRDVAAVRLANGTLVAPPALAAYDGLRGVLDDWDRLEPLLRDLDVDSLPALTGTTPTAPIRYPRKVIGGGPNYSDHVAEMGAGELPPDAAPFFYFVPPSTTLIGDGESILIDADPALKVDWEAELAVVIGRGGRDIPAAEAAAHIAGYACLNDVTARGLMRKNPPLADPFAWDWATCKGLDTFCPLGAVTPAWFVPDPQHLSIRTLVNDVVKQDSSTANMIVGVAALIAEASRFWTLEPGDVLSTGTPAGVGFARGEQLRDGDVVRVEIGDLAPLTNPVRLRRPVPSLPGQSLRPDEAHPELQGARP